MLNKVGLIGSSWILSSDENFIEIDIVILNLHFVRDNITTNFKKCQFAMAHIASRAGNMYCEWIGGCYVHKSLPLELSSLKCVFKKFGNIPTNKTCFQVEKNWEDIPAEFVKTIAPNPWDLGFDSRIWILLETYSTILHLLFLLHVRTFGTFLPRACVAASPA